MFVSEKQIVSDFFSKLTLIQWFNSVCFVFDIWNERSVAIINFIEPFQLRALNIFCCKKFKCFRFFIFGRILETEINYITSLYANTRLAFTCSKSMMETRKQSVKYVQS